MAIDPPYRFDWFQNLVHVHWPEESTAGPITGPNYLLITYDFIFQRLTYHGGGIWTIGYYCSFVGLLFPGGAEHMTFNCPNIYMGTQEVGGTITYNEISAGGFVFTVTWRNTADQEYNWIADGISSHYVDTDYEDNGRRYVPTSIYALQKLEGGHFRAIIKFE